MTKRTTGAAPAPDARPGTLRAALASPWPTLRAAAAAIVRSALTEHETLREAATALGMDDRTLRRLRAEFPDVARGR